jgi:hypothetical protein
VRTGFRRDERMEVKTGQELGSDSNFQAGSVELGSDPNYDNWSLTPICRNFDKWGLTPVRLSSAVPSPRAPRCAQITRRSRSRAIAASS